MCCIRPVHSLNAALFKRPAGPPPSCRLSGRGVPGHLLRISLHEPTQTNAKAKRAGHVFGARGRGRPGGRGHGRPAGSVEIFCRLYTFKNYLVPAGFSKWPSLALSCHHIYSHEGSPVPSYGLMLCWPGVKKGNHVIPNTQGTE